MYMKNYGFPQVGSIPGTKGWLNIRKPIGVTYHINNLNNKSYKVILIIAEKQFETI
jgi:hypothetical protein